MQEPIDKLFYIPKHSQGQMREKAFLARITASVGAIVLRLLAIGCTAYAWFNVNTATGLNKIQSASYNLTWSITETDAGGQEQTSIDTGIVLENNALAPKTYKINIKQTQNSTATTGFCVINVDFNNDNIPDEIYHTAQIGKDLNAPDGQTTELNFNLTLNQAAKVTFSSHWGTSSVYSGVNANSTVKHITDNTVVIGQVQPEITKKEPEATPEEPKE